MTISSTTRLAGPFAGTGVLVPSFPFTFKVFLNTDILVVINVGGVQQTLNLTSDYSVALNSDQDGSPGGTITLNPATVNPNIASGILPVGGSMVVSSQVPQLQSTTLTNFGGFFPTVINAALDRLTILVQQIQQLLGRGITAPITDTPGLNYQLPPAATRANQGLVFDSVGNVTVGAIANAPVSTAMQPVVAAASLAAATTALGLGSIATQNANAVAVTGGAIDGTVIGATTPANAFVTNAMTNTASAQAANMLAVQNSVAGFKNKFRNAVYDIWSRGVSITVNAGTSAYTADGQIIGATGGNASITQGSVYLGGGVLTVNIQGSTGLTDLFIRDRIESFIAAPLTGQRVTVTYAWFNNTGGAVTPTLTVKYPTSRDAFGSLVTLVNAVNLQSCPNGHLTVLSYTFDGSTLSGNFGVETTIDFGGAFNGNSTSGSLVYKDIRATPGVAIGLNNNPPLPEFKPIVIEKLINYYYLPSFNALAANALVPGSGGCNSTTTFFFAYKFVAPVRAPVTGISTSAASGFIALSSASSSALTALGFVGNAGEDGAIISGTVAAGLISGQTVILYSGSSSGQILFTGAEL